MKKNVYIMYAMALLQGMVFYSPIATLYRQAQGVSVFQITIIESISLALCILFEIPWGVVADRIGYRKTMVFCSGLYFVSKIIFRKATGFGGFSGVDSSILYLSCRRKDTQKVFGIYHSLGTVGLLIAAAVFSVFVQEDYALAALLTVVSYGVAALLSLGLTEVKQRRPEKWEVATVKDTIGKVVRDRSVLLFLIAVAFLSETHQTITVFLNQLKYERVGLESSAMGVIYILATMLGVFGAWSTAVTNRMGVQCSLMFFCGLAVISCLMLGFATAIVPSVLGILTLRMVDTLFQPLQMEIQNSLVHTENHATVLSVYAMIIDCVGIGTNLVFGVLSDWNLSLAFFFGGGLCGMSLILFLLRQKGEIKVK